MISIAFFRNPEIYKVDHRYPGKLTDGKPEIILYGEIGTKSFNALHKKLKALADAGNIIYFMRHFVRDRKSQKVRLSGIFTCLVYLNCGII